MKVKVENYKIVTLCGSTRFKEQFIEVQKRLTLEGCIVKGFAWVMNNE